MAHASHIVRAGAVQKAFWLRNGLAERLKRVVRDRRKAGEKFSERRALALAVAAFVEQEESASSGASAPTREDLLEQLDETLAKLKALGTSGA